MMTRDEFREAAEVVEGLRVSLWFAYGENRGRVLVSLTVRHSGDIALDRERATPECTCSAPCVTSLVYALNEELATTHAAKKGPLP